MVRPYTMKGQKRKKKREEKYERGEEEEELNETVKRSKLEKTSQGEEEEEEEEEEEDAFVHEMEGIPVAVRDQNKKRPDVIFVLEKASLEVAKVGKSYQILNSDDHANFLRRNNKNPADYRPDIVHQALLSILDSPLTKAGRLRAVYVRTDKGVLFEVKPHVRLPMGGLPYARALWQ